MCTILQLFFTYDPPGHNIAGFWLLFFLAYQTHISMTYNFSIYCKVAKEYNVLFESIEQEDQTSSIQKKYM